MILEDGTGEAHLYCENNQVPEMLKISNEKWQKLQFSVQSKGSVVYIKHKFNIVSCTTCSVHSIDNKYDCISTGKKFFFGKPTDPDNSAELERLFSRSCVYRYIQANVCPFVSKSQQLIKDKEGMNVHWATLLHHLYGVP